MVCGKGRVLGAAVRQEGSSRQRWHTNFNALEPEVRLYATKLEGRSGGGSKCFAAAPCMMKPCMRVMPSAQHTQAESCHVQLAAASPLPPAASLAQPPCSEDPRRTKRGLFAHPPRPSSFNTTGMELMRDLLAIEVGVCDPVAQLQLAARVWWAAGIQLRSHSWPPVCACAQPQLSARVTAHLHRWHRLLGPVCQRCTELHLLASRRIGCSHIDCALAAAPRRCWSHSTRHFASGTDAPARHQTSWSGNAARWAVALELCLWSVAAILFQAVLRLQCSAPSGPGCLAQLGCNDRLHAQHCWQGLPAWLPS